MADRHAHDETSTPDPDTEPVDGRRNPTRGRGRGRTTSMAAVVAAFVAGSVLSGAGAVWAGHLFADVPDDHRFHEEIGWLVDQGIASGYDDGTFRPTAPVSRQAAAAFLHRYNEGIEVIEVTHRHKLPSSSALVLPTCPVGKRAVGGGGVAEDPDVFLRASSPQGDGEGWRLVFAERDGAAFDEDHIDAWVLCVPGLPAVRR